MMDLNWEFWRNIILDGTEMVLTEEQTRTLAPLPNGRYRVYRYECLGCSAIGAKSKFDDAIRDGIAHGEEFNHDVTLRGGIFYLD